MLCALASCDCAKRGKGKLGTDLLAVIQLFLLYVFGYLCKIQVKCTCAGFC